MKLTRISISILLIIASLLAPGAASASGKPARAGLALDITTVLMPGMWHGWVIGPVADGCGFTIEVTPLRPLSDGAYVQTARVLPEYDGMQWNNVLRVLIPAESDKLPAKVRVYRLCGLDPVFDGEVDMLSGEWMGFVVGQASENRGYLIDVDPLEPSVDGAYIDKALVQQEYPWGEWLDILRVQAPVEYPDIKARIRVYAVQDLAVLAEYDTCLEPGVWHGFWLQPSREEGSFIVETTPLYPPEAGEYVEIVAVQPEFDGRSWNDVLRLQAAQDQPGICVQVRIYLLLP